MAAAVAKGNGDISEYETSKSVRAIPSFDRMSLKEDLLRGIYSFGFEKPSAIQQRAVVPIVEGRDVIAQAQSGTGKSSLIGIISAQLIDVQTREVQVRAPLISLMSFPA